MTGVNGAGQHWDNATGGGSNTGGHQWCEPDQGGYAHGGDNAASGLKLSLFSKSVVTTCCDVLGDGESVSSTWRILGKSMKEWNG
eukprot:CAMPEP_0183296522 /NCGR_PEP_ID=MMETSP0160_2-20130417/4039_1 /TAXON_ID=2839 ORGANISM="Odontella Sinensis, Strain Grunow 1884" /NCGR_SAMPLE_ID=MMETSP0160_2 /ASSEMBLY_ACC=CAM_ASM_000250 /LENGTH=84 /DNA_ID=CAMNT_0025458141 /DNA_START=149 /DNA_END=403 /DNA_ORIENTATION=+